MTRLQWLLAGLLAAEAAVGAFLVFRHLNQPTPPLPDLAALDKVSAAEIAALAAHCRTTDQWARLGEVYLATGYFPEAEACLREAVARDPASAEVTFKHAFALERLGQLGEANALYSAAIALNHPRAADCWYYIGKNHLRLGKEERATAAFERAGNMTGARYELALSYARTGKAKAAEEEAKRLAKEYPAAYPPVSLLYRLALAGNDAASKAMLADAFARKAKPLPTPFDKEVDWVLGTANQVGQNRLFGEGGRALQASQFDLAEKKLRSALAAGWSPEIADKLADVLFTHGNREEAVTLLEEAVDRGRPSFELLWRLGLAHAGQKRTAMAAKLWHRAAGVATGPGARELWQDLADHYTRTGDVVLAKKFGARSAFAAGMSAFAEGQLGSATQAFKKAVSIDPQLAHGWYWLGEVHRASGKSVDAREAYEQCLHLDANHGRAHRAMELLGPDHPGSPESQ